ncbi:MAG: ribonuclease Y [Chloroflexi bacterium]|nr:ribonuclease Y [Chloroflexota bacterium]
MESEVKMIWTVIWLLLAFALGGTVGFLTRQTIIGRKIKAIKAEAERLIEEAEKTKKDTFLQAKEEAIKTREAAEAEAQERRNELRRLERRLFQKEENLDRKLENLERRERSFTSREREMENLRLQAEELRKKQVEKLELISGMSTSEAKDLLLKSVEADVEKERARRIWEMEQKIKEEAEEKARKSIAVSIQRLASDVVSETTVTVVPIPSDDMKGRLIGREGRNIRALENATGVDLIIDDTPEAVTLSTFDPIRREVARLAISKLIMDGRIHPARIEDVVEKAKKEVEETIKTVGEQAIYEVGIAGLHPELIKLLGRLKYRYSYGQNVLKHSIEVAHLAGMMASEIGANIDTVKKAGILHDIGKAVTHEVEGPHAEIGAEMARKYDVQPEVVKAIEEHHKEEPGNMEAFLVSAADAISGGRPGARRDTVENYIKRLEALENVAGSFPGVEKSFAIQAGREVRIMVKPEEIDDAGAAKLAMDIVKKIEETVVYPGQIKVTVIRETRSTEFAK